MGRSRRGGEVLVNDKSTLLTHHPPPSIAYLLSFILLLGGLFLRLVLGRRREEIEAEAGTHKHQAEQSCGGGKEEGPKQGLDAQLGGEGGGGGGGTRHGCCDGCGRDV